MQNPAPATRPSKLPAELKPYLSLFGEGEGLPICRICETAILPRSLLDHMRKQHNLCPALRQIVKTLISTLPSLEFNDLHPLPTGSIPIEGLHVVDAFQCKRCAFIRRDVTDVRRHVNQVHEVGAGDEYESVKAQSWFGGRRAVYWRVDVGSEERQTLSDVPPCFWAFYGKGFGHRAPRSWASAGVICDEAVP